MGCQPIKQIKNLALVYGLNLENIINSNILVKVSEDRNFNWYLTFSSIIWKKNRTWKKKKRQINLSCNLTKIKVAWVLQRQSWNWSEWLVTLLTEHLEY